VVRAEEKIAMDSTPTILGTVEFTELTSSLFEQLTELARGVARSDLDERAARLKTVLLAVSVTGRGCLLVARAGLANEAVMLSRALGERIVNVCYLMLAAGDDFTRYFNHAHLSVGSESGRIPWASWITDSRHVHRGCCLVRRAEEGHLAL
jgi:hypothetical protein